MCSCINDLQTILRQFWCNTGIGVTRLVAALNKVLLILGKDNRGSFTKQLISCSKYQLRVRSSGYFTAVEMKVQGIHAAC